MPTAAASDLDASPQTLKESRLAHAALEGVVMVDMAQRIVMINPAALTMFGLTREQALGMPLSELIPHGFRDSHRQHVEDFRASGQAERSMGQRGRVQGLRANGEVFPIEAAIFRSEVVQPGGTQTYFTALLHDLSELRRMSSTIDQLNRRLRSLFERVPVAVWIAEDERVVFANPAIAQLTGFDDPSALLGRSIYEFLSPPSHQIIQRHLRGLGDEDSASVLPGVVQRADGTLREVELLVGALPDGDRRIVQMVLNDVSQRKREKEDLVRSRHAFRELSANLVEAREEEHQRIARELHDELGQKLTALKLEVTSCMRDYPNIMVAERAQGMLDLLDDTVAAARRISMDLRPLMLDDLGLVDAIDWLARDFERRSHVAVALHLGEGLGALPPRTVTALYRIVQEALTNIARHARASRASITLERKGQDLRLVVQDNGMGYPKDLQVHRAGSFGLLGIRERVLMLGGRLSLSEAKGGGSRLAVRVPLVGGVAPTAADMDLSDLYRSNFEESTRDDLEPE